MAKNSCAIRCFIRAGHKVNIDDLIAHSNYFCACSPLHQIASSFYWYDYLIVNTIVILQVRLFDSQHYLKAFRAGDVWVAVGWSSDVIPVAKTMSNVAVMVPKSGASLWADFWAIPATSRLVTDQIGGRVRGASPLVQQWVEFCLQPQRALPFNEGIIPGASPLSLKAPLSEQARLPSPNGGRPKLETNLIANIPPADILSKCELLEPMAEEALSDYKWLISSLQKPNHTFINRLRLSISSLLPAFLSKIRSVVAA